MILKPVSEGSSLGMFKVCQSNELLDAFETVLKYDGIVLAEEYIHGNEITVSILKEKTLLSIKIRTKRDFYDFTAKYESDDTEYICLGFDDNKNEKLYSELAIKAFNSLKCRGWGRVDFICDQDDSPKILEINTIPGMTKKSLVPKAAAKHETWQYYLTIGKAVWTARTLKVFQLCSSCFYVHILGHLGATL